MELLGLLVIAVSLAMDAMAVSVSIGVACPQGGVRQGARLGLWFGSAQFLMPLLGLLLGRGLAECVRPVSHFVAFGLLAFIGARMVWDTFANREAAAIAEPPGWRRLLALAVATSVDALAVGVSISFFSFPVLLSAAVIGMVAFLLSFAGALAGRALGGMFRSCAQLLGGAALIVLGFKFLVERLG